MPHDHDHGEHEALIIEDEAGNIEAQIVVDALQQVLAKKGLLTAHEVTAAIAKLESPGLHLRADHRKGMDRSRLQSAAFDGWARRGARTGYSSNRGADHRRREYATRSQSDHLYAVLVLSALYFGAATVVVYFQGVSCTFGARATRGFKRIRAPRARRYEIGGA